MTTDNNSGISESGLETVDMSSENVANSNEERSNEVSNTEEGAGSIRSRRQEPQQQLQSEIRGDNQNHLKNLLKDEAKKGEIQILLALSASIEQRIENEGNWLTNRMNWLLLSHAFLLTASAVAAASEVNQEFMKKMSMLLVAFALLLSCSLIVSTTSATASVDALMPLRDELDETIHSDYLGKWPENLDDVSNKCGLGWKPTHCITFGLAILWVLIAIFLGSCWKED